MTFAQLYGTKLDRELGSSDRELFTVALRKEYANEGQQKFNEQTSCFVKRATLAIVDETQEYDVEATGIIAAGDYLWPSKTSASLKRVGASVTSYVEGPDLPFKTEEQLNQEHPNWRAATAGTPECWYLREDGGSVYIGLYPAPDVPSGETWTLLWPYVARPADMVEDDDEPFSVSGNPRTTLIPYHEGLLYWAAAQCELLRKNKDGHEWQMARFAAVVAKYLGDRAPMRGTSVRLRTNFRPRRMARVAVDPVRWP